MSYLRDYICMFRRKTIQAEWAGVTYHPGMCGAVENHFPRIYQSGNTHQVSRPRQFRCHTRRASLMRQAYNRIAQLLSLEHNIPCYPSLKRTLPGKHGNVTSKEMHGVLSYNFPLLTHLHCAHNRRKVTFVFFGTRNINMYASVVWASLCCVTKVLKFWFLKPNCNHLLQQMFSTKPSIMMPKTFGSLLTIMQQRTGSTRPQSSEIRLDIAHYQSEICIISNNKT